MNWKRLRLLPISLFASMLSGSGLLSAQNLPDEQRTNGAETLTAVASLKQNAIASTIQLGKDRKTTLTGVILSPDGYVLTQSSEAEYLKPWLAFLPDGTEVQAREVHREHRLNLLILKIERTSLQAIAWGAALPLQAGQWLSSLTQQGKEIRLGVVSAKNREIPDSGAVMGIRFGPSESGDVGVIIEEVAENGPANVAGLEAEDLLLSLDGKAVAHSNAVKKIVQTHHVGDEIRVRYSRKGAEAECVVRLASKNHVLMNWSGEDFANHGISLRTDNFPNVLQHDIPLSPADMGGAVFNLQGEAVGLNIARVDRVTNYALPVEKFLPEVQQWIKEDRQKQSPKSAPDPVKLR